MTCAGLSVEDMDVSVGGKALVKNTIPRPALCVLYFLRCLRRKSFSWNEYCGSRIIESLLLHTGIWGLLFNSAYAVSF